MYNLLCGPGEYYVDKKAAEKKFAENESPSTKKEVTKENSQSSSTEKK